MINESKIKLRKGIRTFPALNRNTAIPLGHTVTEVLEGKFVTLSACI